MHSSSYSHMRVINHNWPASSSTECSRDKPPFGFVRGQDSTMWDIVWDSPQGHRSVSVSRHFLLQAPQCPCSVLCRPLLASLLPTSHNANGLVTSWLCCTVVESWSYDRRTFPVLGSTYSWPVTTCVGKPSAIISQPGRLSLSSFRVRWISSNAQLGVCCHNQR